jgi:hypothetical protein
MILNKFINFLSKLQKNVNFSGYNIELTQIDYKHLSIQDQNKTRSTV